MNINENYEADRGNTTVLYFVYDLLTKYISELPLKDYANHKYSR